MDGFTATYLDKDGNTVEYGVNGGTIRNSKLPSTGDGTPLALLATLALFSAAGIALLLMKRKKA